MPSISDISVALFLKANCGQHLCMKDLLTVCLSVCLTVSLYGCLSASTEINWSKATSATVKVQKCHSTNVLVASPSSPWGRLFDPMLWSICQNIFSARHLCRFLCVFWVWNEDWQLNVFSLTSNRGLCWLISPWSPRPGHSFKCLKWQHANFASSATISKLNELFHPPLSWTLSSRKGK